MHSKVEALKELRKHFEGDRLNVGASPELIQMIVEIVQALPPGQAALIWGKIEDKLKVLSPGGDTPQLNIPKSD